LPTPTREKVGHQADTNKRKSRPSGRHQQEKKSAIRPTPTREKVGHQADTNKRKSREFLFQ